MPDKNPKGGADKPGEVAEETFLERWSRLKTSGGSPEGRADSPADAPVAAEPDAAGPADPPPALTDADMPDLDTIDEHSDVSGFLSAGVSEGLRRKALRKLFRGAKFNLRDGLDDYDDDFRSFTPLGGIVTADMRHHMERKIQAAKAAAEKHLASLDDGGEGAGGAEAAAGEDPTRARAPEAAAENDEDSRGENDSNEDSRNA
jgi:hypothetical protein